MTREDIIRMAREAGFEIDCCSLEWHDRIERFAALVAAAKEAELMDGMTIAYMDGYEKGKGAGAAAERKSWPAEMEAMERQVNILTDALAQAKAEEREACAKVCDEAQNRYKDLWDKFSYSDDEARMHATNYCGIAIRARGNA